MTKYRLFITLGLLWFFLSAAQAQEWLKAGPYLQELTEDGVTIVFENTIKPFSATAGRIPVGSPTTAKVMGGSSGKTLSMPFLPDTSSSQEAKKIRL